MSIPTKFLRLIWMGWRARTQQIFYMCSRNVLKYSDFIFYVATTKNNKFDFGSFLDDLSKSLNSEANHLSFLRGDQKLFLSIFDFTDFWKLSWATHKTILNETGINVDQTEKKHAVFPAKFSLFFLKKNAGSSTGKFRMKKWKKTRSKKKCPFCARSFWRLLDVQYYCGMLFRYKYWCPESLRYVRPLYTCHGRPLFQKVPKNRSWGILPKAKCCSLMVQQNFFYRK